jgi:hypothetical protein
MLFIDGEELSVRYDMNPHVRSGCAAMSGAMSNLDTWSHSLKSTTGFWCMTPTKVINSTDKVGTKSQCCGRRLRNWELVKPRSYKDDTKGDAKFMKDIWALKSVAGGVVAPCDNNASTLYFTKVTTEAVWSLHFFPTMPHTPYLVQAQVYTARSPSLEGRRLLASSKPTPRFFQILRTGLNL